MTMAGTSVAQSVAAAPHAAQQVARARDRRESERDRASRRVRDAFEAHLLSLEESQQDQAAPRLHVDEHLPDRSIADELVQPPTRRPRHATPDIASEGDAFDAASVSEHERGNVPAATPDTDAAAGTLYRHLDLTA